jgi:hypothetical protein
MNGYYFSHDSNSRKDPKISALMAKYGMIGYGLYWMLIEVFHEQGGTLQKFSVLNEGLASQFNLNIEDFTEMFNYMIDKCQLFEQNEISIWNNRVIRNLEELNRKRLNKSEAGRMGGLKSGESRSKMKQCFEANEPNEANKIKENKIKENKTNNIEDFINFRKNEFNKYPDAFKNRLQEFGIDKPLVYITNRADDQYKDFVEIIHDSVTDEQWQMQISRGTTSEKIRIELTKFIDYLLKSQSFREYMTKNDFQRHFVNRQKLVK